MGKCIDLTGQFFDRLTVIERASNKVKKKKVLAMWKCRCECGKTVIVSGEALRRGTTRSCGCLQKDTVGSLRRTHGRWRSKLYHIWNSMIQRCENSKDKHYHLYGAEGKTVCDEWHDFQAFYDWAMANGYKEGLTIERIDGTKGYSPENCRWATKKEQANNTRRNHLITYNGKTQTMAQWADEYKIKYKTLNSRINTLKGDIERALNTP